MKKTFRLIVICLALITVLIGPSAAVADAIEDWNETFGGTGWDNGYDVIQLADGSNVIIGVINGDVVLVKTDLNGDDLWSATYGGVSTDYGNAVKLTNDDKFIIAGTTQYKKSPEKSGLFC